MLSDSELVDRVRGGDVESFGTLCRRYERSVLAIAVSELHDIHAAEDVAQATLLLAFQRLATLNDSSKFGPWLMQIGRRQVIETARKRQISVAAGCRRSLEPAACDQTTSDWIDKELLLKHINRLPDHERVLIGLRFFDGHSVAEIAEITARPLGTVTKQLSRAIARLRSTFEREDLQ